MACNGPMTTTCNWTAGPVPEGHGLRDGRQPRQLRRLDACTCASPRVVDRLHARPVRPGRRRRRQGVRAAVAARTASTCCTGPPTSPTSLSHRGSMTRAARTEPTVRRDAGLYGYERALRRVGHGADRRRRRGRTRRLRRPAGRRRGDPRPARRARSPGWPTPSCSPRRPASAATPRSCARALSWSVVVDRVRRVRPARHARRQRRGAAPGAGPARRRRRRTC